MVKFYLKRGNRTLHYDLAEFLMKSGNVSIALIDKHLITKSSESFPYILMTLYVMQQNNLIQSIPTYAQKLNTYVLREYEIFREQQDNLKTMSPEEQSQVFNSKKYRAYLKGLGLMGQICKRMCTLGKISSKNMGSLVKVLKVSKEL